MAGDTMNLFDMMLMKGMFGDKGDSAILKIKGPKSTDIVACSGGYTPIWNGTEWVVWGITELGTYTVSSSTLLSSSSVTITNFNTINEVFLPIRLYYLGDEYTDITGGWAKLSKGTVTKEEDNITVYYNYSDYSANEYVDIGTNNLLNLSGYKTLYAEACEVDGAYSSVNPDYHVRLRTKTGNLYYLCDFYEPSKTLKSGSILPAIEQCGTTNFYVDFHGGYNMRSSAYGKLYKIWLE